MIKLSPSMLACNFANIGEDIKKAEIAGADYLHIDIMDGHFVPNLSFGSDVVAAVRKVSGLIFDVHLMVESPEKYIELFKKAGADIITFHVETCEKAKIPEIISQIHSLGMKAGIAVKPNTPADSVSEFINTADMILVMTVEPGFGGQKIIESTFEKVSEIRKLAAQCNKDIDIEVDGGINSENVKLLTAQGANVIVAGSAIFKAPDIEKAVKAFKNN